MRPYQAYSYILFMCDQVVAGFQNIDLPANGWESSPRLPGAQIILTDGLTYDRCLLRWASNWRWGAPWLRYALIWLRPCKDLKLCRLDERNQVYTIQTLNRCRVKGLRLGSLQGDGGVLIERITFRQMPGLDR
jgi:hypothetical protein